MKDLTQFNSPIGATIGGSIALMVINTSQNPSVTRYIVFGLLGVVVGNFAENKIRGAIKKDYLSERKN